MIFRTLFPHWLARRELSPALANRFTTVWVPSLDDVAELGAILEARLASELLHSPVICMQVVCLLLLQEQTWG